MELQFGSLSRTLTAIFLAIGLSFGGAVAIGAEDDDTSSVSRAYLYQGTTADITNATIIEEIDDLDDFFGDDDDDVYGNNISDDRYDGDDWDDDDWDDGYDDDAYEDDDWDDDDWDDGYDDDAYEDDDWDDDDWDDGYDDDAYDDDDWDDDDDDWDDDDDDWDDFMGQGLNFQDTDDDDHWTVLGNSQDAPAGLLTTEDEIDDDHNLTVQTLVDGDYMIVVHADGNTDSPVLAAGNIEGGIQDGTILVELDEVDASGFEGRAFIEPEDDDDLYELEVTVGIYPAGSVTPMAEPVPTPRG